MLRKIKLPFGKSKATCGKVVVCSLMLMTMIVPVVGAEGLVEGARRIFSTLYEDVAGIITLVAVAMLAIAFITLLFGRSSKSAETSMSWIKRIICVWVIFNCLGAGLMYAEKAFTGLQYEGGGGGGASVSTPVTSTP